MRMYVQSSQLYDTANTDICDQSEEIYDVSLLPNDSWHGQMKIYRTKPDEVLDKSDIKCPGYKNTSTAW
jgi:hypothetical protein